MKNKPDLLSPELRAIEVYIDNFYKSNPLTQLPFGLAAWYMLSFFEDLFFIEGQKTGSHLDMAMLTDSALTIMKYPFLWLWKACQKGGEPPKSYSEYYYDAALQLERLAENYESYVLAFTYATHGIVQLNVAGNRITPTSNYTDNRYESYDRFTSIQTQGSERELNVDIAKTIEQLKRSVVVSEDRFRYSAGKRAIGALIDFLKPINNRLYKLPPEWRFSNYSIKEFRQMSDVLKAMAFAHSIARGHAASKGCIGLGYVDSLIIFTKDKLAWKLLKYANVSLNTALSFINDLTYGNRNIVQPDILIQPIVQLNPDKYAIMPSLILGSAMERNLTILLNKLPSERKVYLHLVDEKENLLKRRFENNLSSLGFRFFSGYVPGLNNLPDIDIALINDVDKSVLVVELKWFTEPAEPREVIEKSEEIEKGISQSKLLSKAFQDTHQPFFNALKIDATYQIYFLVASDNFTGHEKVQDVDIPVINLEHFLEMLKKSQNTNDVILWLKNREYLPIPEKDYKIVQTSSSIGKWDLAWYGIKLLQEK